MFKWIGKLRRLKEAIKNTEKDLETVRKYHSWNEIKRYESILLELKWIENGKRYSSD